MRGVGQRVDSIHVAEGVGGELEVEGRVFAGILVWDCIGQRRRVVGVGHHDIEGIGNAAAVAVAGDHIDAQRADIAVARCTAEGASDRVEAEPSGQEAATGQLCGVGQDFAGIHVAEGVGGKLKVEGRVFGGILAGNGVGHRGRIVGVGHYDIEGVGDSAAITIVGDDIDAQSADIDIGRRATEGAGECIEVEPGGQGAATGQLCGVGQRVASIHVVEGVGGELEVEGCVFAGILVGNGIGQRGGVVGVGHQDTEGVGNAAAVAVAGNEIDAQRADMGVEWRAAEGAGGSIETEPGGQRAAAGQLRGVGQGVAGIRVVEGVASELEVEGSIFGSILVRERVGHGRRVVDGCHANDFGRCCTFARTVIDCEGDGAIVGSGRI